MNLYRKPRLDAAHENFVTLEAEDILGSIVSATRWLGLTFCSTIICCGSSVTSPRFPLHRSWPPSGRVPAQPETEAHPREVVHD